MIWKLVKAYDLAGSNFLFWTIYNTPFFLPLARRLARLKAAHLVLTVQRTSRFGPKVSEKNDLPPMEQHGGSLLDCNIVSKYIGAVATMEDIP